MNLFALLRQLLSAADEQWRRLVKWRKGSTMEFGASRSLGRRFKRNETRSQSRRCTRRLSNYSVSLLAIDGRERGGENNGHLMIILG